jgi:hypothetical protein
MRMADEHRHFQRESAAQVEGRGSQTTQTRQEAQRLGCSQGYSSMAGGDLHHSVRSRASIWLFSSIDSTRLCAGKHQM